MAEEINTEDYKYDVRAVQSRQVYDSYMGILRISPNDGEDDPTRLLEKIGSELKLSDSNGHQLPITFISKEFTDDNWIYVQTKATGNVYVSKSFTSRSTLKLTKGTVNAETSRIIIFEDLSSKETKGILMYPNKRPSSDDSLYFNLNNRHGFWTEKNEKWVTDGERYKLVEQNLLKQKLSWYDGYKNAETKEKNVEEREKVQIDDTYLTQTNNYGEEVPILYTHDYILGTSSTGTTKVFPELDEGTHVNKINENAECNCTKLSWERIDNIIWEKLNEFLNCRDDKDDRFSDTSFLSNNPTYQADSKTFSNDITGWKANAPLLARGVQDGLIMYHAMPFNRYWFHRCRQVLTNMEFSGSNWLDIDPNEKNELNTAKTNKLITAASKATLTPHHSLVKDYLLCNGKEVSVANFPNINLKNDKFFDISQKGSYATKNTTTNKYNIRTQKLGTTHYAVFNSLSSKKLPDLFNFENLSPRFIRGLNFSFSKDQDDDAEENSYIISDEVNFDTKNHRVDNLWESSSTYIMGYCEDDKDCTIQKIGDVFGKHSKFFPKEITNVSKLYNSSSDYLDRKWKHYHLLFSVDSSDRNGTNEFFIAKSKYHDNGRYGREDLDSKSNSVSNSSLVSNPKLRFRIDWESIINEVNKEIEEKKQQEDFNVLVKNVGADGKLNDGWIKYCLYNSNGKLENTHYFNFQPIPTVGLFFNSNVDGKCDTYDFTNYYYYDAEGKQHKIGSLNDISAKKLKQLKIKMNESEGIWPISVAGKAMFSIEHQHTWVRKRRHGTDQEYGNLYKHDVGKYYFHGGTFDAVDSYANETYIPYNGYLWRTMTSLPLTNCEKLGCGDLTDYDENVDKEEKLPDDPDYYRYNNVTDQWRKTITHKKDNIYSDRSDKIKTTDNSPYPSHINLLPLIKL